MSTITDHARAAAVQLGNMTAPDNNARARVIAKHMQAAVAETVADLERQLAALQQRAEAAEQLLAKANMPIEGADQSIRIYQPDGQSFWCFEIPGAQAGPFFSWREAYGFAHESLLCRQLAAAEQRAVEAERNAEETEAACSDEEAAHQDTLRLLAVVQKQLHAHREALAALRRIVEQHKGAIERTRQVEANAAKGDSCWISRVYEWPTRESEGHDWDTDKRRLSKAMGEIQSALALADELGGGE